MADYAYKKTPTGYSGGCSHNVSIN